MILIQRGATTNVIVTATEKQVVPITSFRLIFINGITKREVEYDELQDISASPKRYNEFLLDLSPFAEEDNGFFTYMVFDQVGNLLETGKMKLEDVTTTPTQYQQTPTEYETYGQ